MNWFYLSTLSCLGAGTVIGGIRRKQDKIPVGLLAVIAALMLAYGSLGLGASFIGAWAAQLGDWIGSGTRGSGVIRAASWIAGGALVVGIAAWATAAGKDILADRKPDEPALSFCMGWTIAVSVVLGMVIGTPVHDFFAKLPATWG